MTEKTTIRFDAQSICDLLDGLKADKNGHIRGKSRVIDQIQSLHLQSIEVEEYASQSQPKEISVTDKEGTYMTYFPSKDQIRNMALDIVGYDDDQPQLITQEMAVNFITIFAKWLRDKLKSNG